METKKLCAALVLYFQIARYSSAALFGFAFYILAFGRGASQNHSILEVGLASAAISAAILCAAVAQVVRTLLHRHTSLDMMKLAWPKPRELRKMFQ